MLLRPHLCAQLDTEGAEGVRRGTRHRHPPLEYWRGERIILGRSEEGPAVCPVFKGFLEIPKETPEPLGAKRRKGVRRRARSVSQGRGSRPPSSSRKGSEDPEPAKRSLTPPEEGWDDDTAIDGEVYDFASQAPLHRRASLLSIH